MSKFTAAELVEFYQEVADGAEMLLDGKPRLWAYAYDDGPNLLSDTERWRIKPAKKIIDMAHFIKSGIDCEFSGHDISVWLPLGLLDRRFGDMYCPVWADENMGYYIKCRPRMNHKHFHDGGECPLPEGFKVRLMFRDGAAVVTHTYYDLKWLSTGFKVFTHADIIGYEILGLAEGWAYPWGSDE